MALKSKPSGGSTYPTEKSDEMLQTAFGFYRQRKSRCREGDGRWKNFSNCVEFSSAMPPRGRNKPSENKMQSYRERNNIDDEGEDHHHHLYKMTRWCLREPGHTASPSCLPCTAPITAPGSRPPLLTCPLSSARGSRGVNTGVWSTGSCSALLLSTPKGTGIPVALRRTHEW